MALFLDKSLSLARLLLKVQKQTSVKSTSFIQCDQIIFVSTFGHHTDCETELKNREEKSLKFETETLDA